MQGVYQISFDNINLIHKIAPLILRLLTKIFMMQKAMKVAGGLALTGVLAAPFVEGAVNISNASKAEHAAAQCAFDSVSDGADNRWSDGVRLNDQCVSTVKEACEAQSGFGGHDKVAGLQRRLQRQVCETFLDPKDIENCQTAIKSAVDRCR